MPGTELWTKNIPSLKQHWALKVPDFTAQEGKKHGANLCFKRNKWICHEFINDNERSEGRNCGGVRFQSMRKWGTIYSHVIKQHCSRSATTLWSIKMLRHAPDRKTSHDQQSPDSLWRRANARNVGFQSQYDGRLTFIPCQRKYSRSECRKGPCIFVSIPPNLPIDQCNSTVSHPTFPFHTMPYSGQQGTKGRLGVIPLNCTHRWEGLVEYWRIYNAFPAFWSAVFLLEGLRFCKRWPCSTFIWTDLTE